MAVCTHTRSHPASASNVLCGEATVGGVVPDKNAPPTLLGLYLQEHGISAYYLIKSSHLFCSGLVYLRRPPTPILPSSLLLGSPLF